MPSKELPVQNDVGLQKSGKKKKVVFAELLIVCPCLKTGYLVHEEDNEDLAKLEQVQF